MSWRGRISQCALRSPESLSYPLETRIPLCYRSCLTCSPKGRHEG
jgi:hypothetical protein